MCSHKIFPSEVHTDLYDSDMNAKLSPQLFNNHQSWDLKWAESMGQGEVGVVSAAGLWNFPMLQNL